MKKHTIYILSGILLMLFTLAACHKDNKAGSPPSISRIRLLSRSDTGNISIPVKIDSTGQLADSTYSAIRLVGFDSTVPSGQLSHQYAILGSNLGTLKT